MGLFSSPLLGAAALVFMLTAVVTRRLLSPLNQVPGPLYARFTSCVLRWHEIRGLRTRYIHRLHLRYGPAVRIAPNEVAFASAEAIKEIYGSGGSGYEKTEFYDLFKVYGRRTMFTTLKKEDHAKRRRIIADRYANTNIVRQPSLDGISERADRFVRNCYESVGKSMDVYVTLHAYAFDCVTHHLFHPHDTNSLQNEKDEEVMREVALDSSLQNRLIRYYSPALYNLLGGALRVVAPPRETPLADAFVLNASTKTDAAPFTLLSRLRDKAYFPEHLDDLDIAAEGLDHMAAGIDTTGDALCFLMWELSRPASRHIQQRLRDEVRRASVSSATAAAAPLDKMPFLDAVVMEGLRCFPAIPMSLPRYVGSGGSIVDGYLVPEATIVSCQAYSTQRLDADVFPEPNRFNPGRWLEKEGDAERRRLFFAFASGGRGCVGRHLALAEMKILLQKVYSRFSTVPDESMTEESMAMSDQLISSRPLGQRCLLRFIPVDDADEKA